jgi:hypothetical protein
VPDLASGMQEVEINQQISVVLTMRVLTLIMDETWKAPSW